MSGPGPRNTRTRDWSSSACTRPNSPSRKTSTMCKKAVADLKIAYPVAIDNDYAIWRAFNNQYWPAHYFIDAKGRIRHHHFGEGDYDGIRTGDPAAPGGSRQDQASAGVSSRSTPPAPKPPRTWATSNRRRPISAMSGRRISSRPAASVQDARHVYAAASPGSTNGASSGDWTIGGEHAVLNEKDGSIVYRFHARDLHLVLGPAPDGKPVRFRVTIDGAAPGASHGVDVDAGGQWRRDRAAALPARPAERHRSPTTHSRSSSSIPACRPMHSLSAEIGALNDQESSELRASNGHSQRRGFLLPLLALLLALGLRASPSAAEERARSPRPPLDETAGTRAPPKSQSSPAAASGACRAFSSMSRASPAPSPAMPAARRRRRNMKP